MTSTPRAGPHFLLPPLGRPRKQLDSFPSLAVCFLPSTPSSVAGSFTLSDHRHHDQSANPHRPARCCQTPTILLSTARTAIFGFDTRCRSLPTKGQQVVEEQRKGDGELEEGPEHADSGSYVCMAERNAATGLSWTLMRFTDKRELFQVQHSIKTLDETKFTHYKMFDKQRWTTRETTQ